MNKLKSAINHYDCRNLSVADALTQIKIAAQHPAAQLILTPRVDMANKAYYWVGLRINIQEVNFKLPVNDQVMKFLLSFLKGEENLHNVTDYEPISEITDMEEWLLKHRQEHWKEAISAVQELNSGKDGFYQTEILKFSKGKIKYPAKKFESIFNVLQGI